MGKNVDIMKTFCCIFIGSGLGGACRYFINQCFVNFTVFPLATLCVNILASFILGVAIGFFDIETQFKYQKLFITTGFCGGFSTFSAFSLETVRLLQNNMILLAFANIALNLILCFFAIAIGFWIVLKYAQ